MRLTLFTAAILVSVGTASCSRSDKPSFDQADFLDLGFVIGHWRGAAPGEPVFYETYEIANDTLIRVLYHSDSTTTDADTGVVFLSEGGIYHGVGDEMWRVNRRDEDGFHFDPWLNAGNAFTWQPQPDDTWRAVIHFFDGTSLTSDFARRTS